MAIGKRFSVCSCVLGLLLGISAIATLRAEIPFKHVIVDDDGPTDIQCKAIGDINGDGFPDLVAAGTNGTIVWYEYPKWTKHVHSCGTPRNIGKSCFTASNGIWKNPLASGN
jgi:hypothetical protein